MKIKPKIFKSKKNLIFVWGRFPEIIAQKKDTSGGVFHLYGLIGITLRATKTSWPSGFPYLLHDQDRVRSNPPDKQPRIGAPRENRYILYTYLERCNKILLKRDPKGFEHP